MSYGLTRASALCMTTARAKRRPPRAITSSNSTRRAGCHCFLFLAARSPPIAVCLKKRLNGLSPVCPGKKAPAGWTATAPLPGGDLDVSAIPALADELVRDYSFLSRSLALRLAHAYGTRASKVLGDASSAADLGQLFGDTLTEREVRYLMTHEFARTAEDIVWRRSKLGLRLSADQVKALDDWIATHRAGSAPPVLKAGGRG